MWHVREVHIGVWRLGAWLVLLGGILASGCVEASPDAESSDQRTSADTDNEGLFWGTPVEYQEALAACYERKGVATEPNPDNPASFTIHWGPMSQDERQEVRADCEDELGVWTPETVPQGYVEQQYEHRAWQRDCLIDLGYDLDGPPSFEVYAERLDWDPLGEATTAAGLRGAEFQAVRDECPYLHQWEAQQKREEPSQ